VRFLRIIYDLLEEDGVWINLGPLLWHFENSPTKSAKGEGSIELTLDEVKELAENIGFEIKVGRFFWRRLM
jgi:carnosine N-methyltransferase